MCSITPSLLPFSQCWPLSDCKTLFTTQDQGADSVSADQKSWKERLWKWYCSGWMQIILQTVSSGLEDEAILWTYFVQIRGQGRWSCLQNGILGWFVYMLYAYVSLFSVQWYSLIVLQLNIVNTIYGTVFHYYYPNVHSLGFLYLLIIVSKFSNLCFFFFL